MTSGCEPPDRWVAAGLLDPASPTAADRLALLHWLNELGIEMDSMVAAHRRGRLFALAGDQLARPQAGTRTARDIAETLGVDVALVLRAWRAAGLEDCGADDAVASPADENMLADLLTLIELIGEDAALGFLRVLGAAAARVADAAGSVARTSIREINLDSDHGELVTAQSWARVAGLLPQLAATFDVVLRHHVESTRRFFEALSDAGQARLGSDVLTVCVGFADLSGFTELSRRVALGQLSPIMTAFERTAQDVVHDGAGRVIKFIGDAVMFTTAAPEQMAGIAATLVGHPLARKAGLAVRAGCAYGQVVAQDGDLFGTTVNLAARLTAVARPGQVRVDAALAARLDPVHWIVHALAPMPLRGFEDPIASATVAPAVASSG